MSSKQIPELRQGNWWEVGWLGGYPIPMMGRAGGGRYLDQECGRRGAAEVASELALLGDLLQERVAGDLPRARPP
jgi:hypothetical protein